MQQVMVHLERKPSRSTPVGNHMRKQMHVEDPNELQMLRYKSQTCRPNEMLFKKWMRSDQEGTSVVFSGCRCDLDQSGGVGCVGTQSDVMLTSDRCSRVGRSS